MRRWQTVGELPWWAGSSIRAAKPLQNCSSWRLLPQLDHAALPELVEHLVVQVGEWGAFHVIAEIDETSDAFPALRQAGFSVYAWQRMWDVSGLTRRRNPLQRLDARPLGEQTGVAKPVSSNRSAVDASGGATVEKRARTDL